MRHNAASPQLLQSLETNVWKIARLSVAFRQYKEVLNSRSVKSQYYLIRAWSVELLCIACLQGPEANVCELALRPCAFPACRFHRLRKITSSMVSPCPCVVGVVVLGSMVETST